MGNGLVMFEFRYGALARACKLAAVLFFSLVATVQAEPLRVTIMGDSLVQGYGLAPEMGLVPQLEAWLKADGLDVALLNAGVSGDTTRGGADRADWTLADNPDALVVALGGNDVLRGLDPGAARANLDRILNAAGAQAVPVFLVAILAPRNYGPEYKQTWDEMFPALSAAYGTGFHPGFFTEFESEDPAEFQILLQGDGIHPNPEGVRQIVDGFGPDLSAWLKARFGLS